ncbi:MAG: YceI family protein [Gemmatimonadaceae bacterium]|nr:YceI family protein [Acetobacteraceae bacterium]
MDRRILFPAMGACLVWAATVAAMPRTLTLAPSSAQIGFRAYGMGIIPIDGSFARFSGTLLLDDTNPAACRIDIRADAASLQMGDPAMTADALGPDLLDVAKYPAFAFQGDCRAGRLDGTLLLHGVTRPLSLDIGTERGAWVATGRMRRADWGMGARPLLAGPEVRIRFTAALPAGFPAAP